MSLSRAFETAEPQGRLTDPKLRKHETWIRRAIMLQLHADASATLWAVPHKDVSGVMCSGDYPTRLQPAHSGTSCKPVSYSTASRF